MSIKHATLFLRFVGKCAPKIARVSDDSKTAKPLICETRKSKTDVTEFSLNLKSYLERPNRCIDIDSTF